MSKGNHVRCPGCGRFGSKELGGYCKACYEKLQTEDKEKAEVVVEEICAVCGQPAYKYLEAGGYHSWYCKKHYEDKLEEISKEKLQHVVRDNVKPTNTFWKGEFVPEVDHVGLVKENYGYMR